MEHKTTVHAAEGQHDITVTREFDLPVDWLFEAYTTAELLEEWMNTKVLKLNCRNHGDYRFETTDPKGNKHYFSGTIHSCETNARIVRTFEMEGTTFPVQLEYLTFASLSEHTSKLTIHMVFKSVNDRDNLLKLPFSMGINMAHNRLQEVTKLKYKPL